MDKGFAGCLGMSIRKIRLSPNPYRNFGAEQLTARDHMSARIWRTTNNQLNRRED